MSNIDKINRLPLIDVLSKLWYHEWSHYIKKGKNLRMKDSDGKISDGWVGDIIHNKIFCRSWMKEGRFKWDIVSVIKWAKWIEAAEAINWAEKEFNIEKDVTQAKSNTMKQKWEEMSLLGDEETNYLSSRCIDYNSFLKPLVKKWAKVDSISLAITSESWTIKAIQSRKIIDTDKKFRYQIEKEGDDWTGIFLSLPQKDKKICFVVEGMTDFLTLAQFWVNVIWLVSATAGINYLKAFDKKYNLIYIPDNCDSWVDSVVALQWADIKFGTYRLDWHEDLNDFWNFVKPLGISPTGFLTELYEEAEKPLNNLQLALQKAVRNRDIWSWLIWDLIFDEATGWVTPWSVMIINWLSWEGKTTTLDWIITSLMNLHKKRIWFCSIDDDIGKMLAMFLWRHFWKDWRKEIYPDIEWYVKKYWEEKFDNFLMYDTINTLEWVEALIREEDIDVLVIDYIQVMEGLQGKSMQDKMLQAIRWLQRLSIDTHTAIICLSQVSKWEDQKRVLFRTPMESQYIKSASDTFINVGMFEWEHKIAFVKNIYWDSDYKNTEFSTHWDRESGKISIKPDLLQMPQDYFDRKNIKSEDKRLI